MRRTPSDPRQHARCMLLAGCALLIAPASHAEVTESDYFDELPVVLSVSRLSQPVSDAPAAVTIIDQDMIRASGFRDIPDLLRLVPGFSVAYTRDNTWAAGYHGLADAYSRRFQVLVDGRSIYSPHYGAVNWTSLPLAIEDIERIEVVRGPNAAAYGANSFVAVINIISKTATQVPGDMVSTQFGEQGMYGAVVRHGGGDENMRYRITASAQGRDRFERDVTEKSVNENGRYHEGSDTYFINGRMDWQLSTNSDVMFQFGQSQGNNSAGMSAVNASFIPALLEPQKQSTRDTYLQLVYHKVESAKREWRVQVYHTQNRFDADAVVDLTAINNSYGVANIDQYLLQTRSSIDLQVNEQWASGLRAVWGAEVWRETVKSPQSYQTSSTLSGEIARAFGNLEWRAHERLLFQGGAMLEHHYFTGTDISPRIAANFTLLPDHVIRFGVSRGLRSPTFYEEKGNLLVSKTTGAPLDVVSVPTGGLEPERIFSREIGYVGNWRPLRLELDARLYRDQIDNFLGLVRVLPNPAYDAGSFQPKVFTAANIQGTVEAQGGEVQLRWRPTRTLDVSAHYARVFLSTDTPDTKFVKDIPQSAPRNSWGLLASYRLGKGWEASLFAQRSDTQKWLTEGDIVPAFTRIDARLARRWTWQGYEMEAAVVGQNLGDDYREFRDTNIFSQRVYGSFGMRW